MKDALLCNELKPPFIPKPEKYINEIEIEKQLSLKKTVMTEINVENKIFILFIYTLNSLFTIIIYRMKKTSELAK